MESTQTVEDGATERIAAAMDPNSESGDFYGPTAGWKGYPDKLEPEDFLYSDDTIRINWEGCEEAVGKFKF